MGLNNVMPIQMDDYNLSSLTDSKNEWCARLVNAMTPAVIEGLRSIFQEADTLCEREDQGDKYLMTFQTYLSRIPKWNDEIIKTERQRIEERSRCGYLEDLISCVHIVQLKALTCVRVGQKQKCVDLDIPSANAFVFKVYVLVARRLYTSVYLFEKDIAPLEKQKRDRELELLVKECIMNAIRESVPVEQILKAYVAQTEEHIEEDGSGPPLPPAKAKDEPLGGELPTKPDVDTPPAPAPAASPPPPPPPAPAASPPPKKEELAVNTTSEKKPPAVTTGGLISETIPPISKNVVIPAVVKTGDSTVPSTTPAGVNDAGIIRFSNTDHAMDASGHEEPVSAPKDDAGLKAAEAARDARAPPVDDEPISLAIREMGGIGGLPDAALDITDVEVLA